MCVCVCVCVCVCAASPLYCFYRDGRAAREAQSSRRVANIAGVAVDHHSTPSAGIVSYPAHPPPLFCSNKTIRIYSELNGACDNVNITQIYVILCCTESVTFQRLILKKWTLSGTSGRSVPPRLGRIHFS